ncbi:tetratricopeptide repeat protein [Chitinolyticbacter meiyuanensis]|uniref:tetratricopeptide repeat protein n=1 Tax=Chitinolyticbacter meiyuanensis TaxID=682798 RepID=UPI0016526F57|nr:tetratricopeptide repeat protein [Chitinolyticbacter meiyuanensis]
MPNPISLRYSCCALLCSLAVVATAAPAEEQENQSEIEQITEQAKAGDPAYQFRLGAAYELGLGVPKNTKLAIHWYLTAAEQGYALAQYSLGQIYINARGVPRDFAEAARWHRKAAEQGNAAAQIAIGRQYAYGWGVRHNGKTARNWFITAAQQKPKQAYEELATLYERGNVVPKNLVVAYALHSIVAEGGDELARDAMNGIEPALDEKAFHAAKQMAARLIENPSFLQTELEGVVE